MTEKELGSKQFPSRLSPCLVFYKQAGSHPRVGNAKLLPTPPQPCIHTNIQSLSETESHGRTDHWLPGHGVRRHFLPSSRNLLLPDVTALPLLFPRLLTSCMLPLPCGTDAFWGGRDPVQPLRRCPRAPAPSSMTGSGHFHVGVSHIISS